MEKAILKTLIYADLFDYPLKTYELHKWLIGEKVTLRQLEKALKRLQLKSKIKNQNGFWFLPKKKALVRIRKRNAIQSKNFAQKAEIMSHFLKIIPWVKLVGISGGLAMENAGKKDDIDLFIIAEKNRLWISRLCVLLILSLAGQRRKANESGRKIVGKFCLNTLLEEDRLEQENRDIFVAHEVLQMKVLWQRNEIYKKYLEDNTWTFNFLPNWISNKSPQPFFVSSRRRAGSNSDRDLANWIPAFAGMTAERMAKWFQLKIMQAPIGMERIGDGFLYFHPQDCRPKILSEYKKRVMKIISP